MDFVERQRGGAWRCSLCNESGKNWTSGRHLRSKGHVDRSKAQRPAIAALPNATTLRTASPQSLPGPPQLLPLPARAALPSAAFSTLPPALPALSELPALATLPALSFPALATPPQSPALSSVGARSFGAASTMRSDASAATLGAADAMAMLVRIHDLLSLVSLADLLVAQWLCRVRSRSRDVVKPIAGAACDAMRQHYFPI
jgi:hypothetical protein